MERVNRAHFASQRVSYSQSLCVSLCAAVREHVYYEFECAALRLAHDCSSQHLSFEQSLCVSLCSAVNEPDDVDSERTAFHLTFDWGAVD